MFIEKTIQGKRIYCSDILEIEHFFNSRDFMVKENLPLVADYFNLKPENIIKPTQTHSKNVEIFDENKKEYPDCDGIILNKKGFGLYLNFADCTPIILYDNKNNIASIVHAGWRGTAEKIAIVAIEKMKNNFNTNSEDITAIVGPAISFKNFETSKEVINKLKSTIRNPEGLFNDNHADLKGINAEQLKEAGVKKIDICPYCTVDDNDKFFSYRKEDKTKNRHSAFIKL